ncbi:MAG: hypothetical protein PUJ27_04140 [Lachnobacterium sp.]|nr:hypothetical protein [Lachnobacterium sp.]MDY5460762.1 hypothetical protein [Agathobacter sp.]
MKRFVTYLYEYDRTIRGRNVGFIRNDIRNDCCRMEIHIRGLERIKEKAPIFIIVRDSECIGIPAGEVVISQGVGNACLELRGNRIGKTDYSVNNIQAVIVRYNGGKMLMGCYVQHPAGDLLSGTFTKWEAQATPASPTPDPDAARGVDSNSGDLYPNSRSDLGTENDSGDLYPNFQSDLGIESNSADLYPNSQSDLDTENNFGDLYPNSRSDLGTENDSDDLYPNSQNDLGTENNFGDLYPYANNSQGTEAKTEEICPTSEEAAQSPIYKRIAITDIRSLPSRNWHLCNNSFLVHGFFCYHYLILKTINAPDGAKMYLGVPGIYASQERMMALLFGFNDFEIATDNMMGKSDTSDIKYSSAAQNDSGDKTNSDSQPSAGDFGYWLCPLET